MSGSRWHQRRSRPYRSNGDTAHNKEKAPATPGPSQLGGSSRQATLALLYKREQALAQPAEDIF